MISDMDTLMSLTIIFISLFAIQSVQSESSVVTKSCTQDDSLCYYLYRSGSVLDWFTAYTQCQSWQMNLAFVRTAGDQAVVQGLTSSGSWSEHAWISATRSRQTSWTALDNAVFTSNVQNDDPNNRCLTINSESGVYASYPCPGNENGEIRFLCQYPALNGGCSNNGHYVNQRCYKVPMYDDPEIDSLPEPIYSWDGANQFCRISYGGTLAYTNLQESSVRNYVQTLVQQKYGQRQPVWIGVRREMWVWWRGNTEDPMVYTNWLNQEGAQKGNTCAHLDLSENSRWGDKVCTDRHSYFVCQSGFNGPRPSVPTTIMPPTTTTTTTTTPSTTSTTTTPSTTTPSTTTPSTTTPTTPTTPSTTTPTTATPSTTTPTTTTPSTTTPSATTPSTTTPTTTTPATTTTTTTTTTSTTTSTTTTTTTPTAPPTSPTTTTTTLQLPSTAKAIGSQINTLNPTFGPLAGGTQITVTGDNLGAVNVLFLGDNMCNIISNQNSMIVAETPPNNRVGPSLLILQSTNGNRIETTHVFEYRLNPTIDTIGPNTTIKEGGTTLTVGGKNLDSVADPLVMVRLNTSMICKNALGDIREYLDDCNSTGATIMLCRVPTLEILNNKSGCVLKDLPPVEVFFKLDGVPEQVYYMNMHDKRIFVRLSPVFDDTDKIYMFERSVDIAMRGQNIDSISRTDYSIDVILDGFCEVTDHTSNFLFCRPPQEEPSKRPGDDNHNIIVHAGSYLHLKVGVIQYTPGLAMEIIIAIAVGAVVFVALIVVIVVVVVRKKRRIAKMSKELLYDHPADPMSDWPYDQRIHLPPIRTDMEETGTMTSRYSSTVGEKLRIGSGSVRGGFGGAGVSDSHDSTRSASSSRHGTVSRNDFLDEEGEDELEY